PLHSRGASVRNRSPDRNCRIGRQNHAGNPFLQFSRGQNLWHAFERTGARLPLFSRPRPLAVCGDEKREAEIRRSLPELPEARRQRMVADYGITAYDAQVLTSTKHFADQFEAAPGGAKNPKRGGTRA